MDLAIILTIVALLIGMKVISSIWKAGIKEADEYNKLALDAEFRDKQLEKYMTKFKAGNKNDSKLIYKIARINALGKNYTEASKYFQMYNKLVTDDAEGFAELSDIFLNLSEYDKAKSAIEKAIELEPNYEEYRELQLRIGLQAKDTKYAENASIAWIKLDEERVNLNKRPHRWSPMYQIGPKQATPDVAIKSYLTAILHLKNESEAAINVINNMNETEFKCFESLTEEDKLFSELKGMNES